MPPPVRARVAPWRARPRPELNPVGHPEHEMHRTGSNDTERPSTHHVEGQMCSDVHASEPGDHGEQQGRPPPAPREVGQHRESDRGRHGRVTGGESETAVGA